MRGGGGSLEACRTTAVPKVRACVESALKAANGRANVPVAMPSEPVPRQPREDGNATAPSVAFIAPPRTISDITAILDSEKPDPKLIDELKAKADAQLPAKGSPAELARLYYARGNARAQLGRLNDALADANKAIEAARGGVDANLMGRLAQFAGIQYSAAGDPKKAFEIFSRQVREANVPGAKGYLFNGYRQISAMLIQMGDIAQAEAFLRRSMSLIEEMRTSGVPDLRSRYAVAGQTWEADVEYNRAIIFEARGQFREAEISYRIAEQRHRAGIKGILSLPNPPTEAQLRLNADTIVLSLARTKARQGRLAEAEADARRALLGRLQSGGKYNPVTPKFVTGLAGILVEQGRYGEAEALMRVGIDINRAVGVAEDSQSTAAMLSSLGSILNLQRKFKEAVPIYVELDRAIAGWAPQRRETLEFTGARVFSLYASGQTEAGITAAQKLLQRSIARVGEGHFDTATARGTLAVGYMRAGRDADADREFKAAIPSLIAAAHENADDEDTTLVAARAERLQNIVEAYIRLLARHKDDPGSSVSSQTFQLAEAIRGHSVQQALAASSARMIAKDPALAVLVRKEQDLVKGTSNNDGFSAGRPPLRDDGHFSLLICPE
jgi:tetratricopeptide (TPR) repeat protein